MKPLLSILIPAYNAEMWLTETLGSALGQIWDNKEIIIIDDGSKDETLALARNFETERSSTCKDGDRQLNSEADRPLCAWLVLLPVKGRESVPLTAVRLEVE